MHKTKENGLVFNVADEARYLSLPSDNAQGNAHDEWKLIPWGIPEHRQVPVAAAMSNTVQMRLDGVAEYHPENLNLQSGKLMGYPVADVLPYKLPEFGLSAAADLTCAPGGS